MRVSIPLVSPLMIIYGIVPLASVPFFVSRPSAVSTGGTTATTRSRRKLHYSKFRCEEILSGSPKSLICTKSFLQYDEYLTDALFLRPIFYNHFLIFMLQILSTVLISRKNLLSWFFDCAQQLLICCSSDFRPRNKAVHKLDH